MRIRRVYRSFVLRSYDENEKKTFNFRCSIDEGKKEWEKIALICISESIFEMRSSSWLFATFQIVTKHAYAYR